MILTSRSEANPYRISGPALISFSGGRTSAYMLHQILHAHGGSLPDDVVVAFANTGKEREETLRFVHECGSRWGVPIRWVEWRADGFAEVGYNSASRAGEPFAALIERKGYLPNSQLRYCTIELKIRTMTRFARDGLGWKHWANVIGLRHDEGSRLLKAYAANDNNRERFTRYMPMDKARATVRDVATFWSVQPFDLGLRSFEGNCDNCFLKSRPKLLELARRSPASFDWWIGQEARVGQKQSGRVFRDGDTYSAIRSQAGNQTDLFEVDDGEHDAECGLACAA